MAVRRKRKAAWEEVQGEPVPVQGLLDLRNEIDTGHRRAEITEGQLVVSPLPVFWHEQACRWLEQSFGGVCEASDWFPDRAGVKPRARALAGIPLYLLVDRFTKPVTISLHSKPGANGYAKVSTVTAGEELRLPAPFGLILDASSLPLPE
jgi:Uma2 family endonuclease